MALALDFKYEITSDKTKVIVTDQTGLYSVNNVGGWGSPNIDRNSVGLYAYVTYQPYNTALKTLTSLTPVFDIDVLYGNDYESVFEFSYFKDGWYRILLVAMTQLEYDAITDPELLIGSITYPNTYKEDIVMVNLATQYNCLLEDYFECIQANICKCDPIQEKAVKLKLLIEASDYRFHSTKQLEAQKMVENLTLQYKCCK
jgi:hypothetical protein